MNRAYSLVETLVGMVLNLAIFGWVLTLGRQQVDQHIQHRLRNRAGSSLEMAADELDEILGERDPTFWSDLSVDMNFFHGFDAFSNGIGFHADCPGEFESACLTFIDVHPNMHPDILKMDASEFPFELQTTGDSWIAEPDQWAGSVGVLCDGEHQSLIIIESATHQTIRLLNTRQYPWAVDEIAFDGPSELALLGEIRILHVGLKPVGKAGMRLTYRPLVLRDGEWHKARSFSSYQNLASMVFMSDLSSGPQIRLYRLGVKEECHDYATIQ